MRIEGNKYGVRPISCPKQLFRAADLGQRGSDPLNSVSDLSRPRYGSRQGDFSGSVGFDLAGKFAEDQFL